MVALPKLDNMREECREERGESVECITKLDEEDRLLKAKLSAVEEIVDDAINYARKDTRVFSADDVPCAAADGNCPQVVLVLVN